jgi:flagellar basal-body rod protein FlgG
MENTGVQWHVAIEGDGFFQVTLPNGGARYSRDGALRANAEGNLVTSSGYVLSPSISIPQEAVGISIGKDGTVVAFVGQDRTAQQVGQIQLARFANPSGLSAEGGNLLAQTEASGAPVVGNPGDSGIGSLQQGFLEKSNVQMVTELVNLITAQRAYETNSRAIKAGDDMLTTANRLIG